MDNLEESSIKSGSNIFISNNTISNPINSHRSNSYANTF